MRLTDLLNPKTSTTEQQAVTSRMTELVLPILGIIIVGRMERRQHHKQVSKQFQHFVLPDFFSLPFSNEFAILGFGSLEPDVTGAFGQHCLELPQESGMLLTDLQRESPILPTAIIILLYYEVLSLLTKA